jgi:hypothetical protein
MELLALAGPLVLLKFAAYTLAGHYLLRAFGVEGSAVLFGLTRALAGLGLGVLAMWWLRSSLSDTYALVVLIHFIAWSGCIAVFFARGGEDWSKVLFAALLGTVYSMILDLPSVFVALPLLGRTC